MSAFPTKITVERQLFANPRPRRALPYVLSTDPKGEKLVYTSGKYVYIRDVENPGNAQIYTEHSKDATVAKMSPSGQYVISGETSGKIRIWATDPDLSFKSEHPFLHATVRDIAWSSDSKRVALVGDGNNTFGHVFLFDLKTRNGEVGGHSRPILTVDFSPVKPLAFVTGSEDYTIVRSTGPPFKVNTASERDGKTINALRYKQDGTLIASGLGGGLLQLRNPEDLSVKHNFVDPAVGAAAHAGSIYSVSWSPDGSKLVSSSTTDIKIWDAATGNLLHTITVGTGPDNQQLGVIWLPSTIVALSGNGVLRYINPDTGAVSKVVHGHNNSVMSLALSNDKLFAFTGDVLGVILRWNLNTGEGELLPSKNGSAIVHLAVDLKGSVLALSTNNKLVVYESVNGPVDQIKVSEHTLSAEPRDISVNRDDNTAYVAAMNKIIIFKNNSVADESQIAFDATSIAVQGKILAVGGRDSRLRIYEINGTKLTEKNSIAFNGEVTSLDFSANGKYLVASDATRAITAFAVDNDFKEVNKWTNHYGRVIKQAVSPSSKHIASIGLDNNLFIFDLQNFNEYIFVRAVHAIEPPTDVHWLNDNVVITTGRDGNVKFFHLE